MGSRIRWITSPPNPHPIFSEGIPTGAAPCGFRLNFLLIESLQRIHYYYGDEFKVECPTGSGQKKTLWEAASEIIASSVPHIPEVRWAPSRLRQRIYFSKRSTLARLDSFLRIFPRRDWCRPGREPPDWMDRPRCQADSAERRIAFHQSQARESYEACFLSSTNSISTFFACGVVTRKKFTRVPSAPTRVSG